MLSTTSVLGRVEASNLVTADANRDISNARNLRVTGDVSAQSFSVDGQTLFNTSNILGRVEASNLVTADANRDISNARNLRVTGDVSAQSFSIDGQHCFNNKYLR